MIHHIKRATRHLIFWSLIATAIGLTALRLLMLEIDGYKLELAGKISELVGTSVSIGRLATKMRGLSPELVLRDINVAATDQQQPSAIQLKEIRLRVNLLELLLKRELLPATWITLVGAKLAIQRKTDGSFIVIGLKAGDGQPLWLLQGGRYEMLQSEITFQDQNHSGQIFKPAAVDLAIANSGAQHQINAIIKLPEHYGGSLALVMGLQGNFFEPAQLNGKIFAQAAQLNLGNILAGYLPSSIHVNAGLGNAKLWGHIKNSQLVDFQGDINLEQLHISGQQQNTLPFGRLQSRFHWHQDPSKPDKHWQLDIPQLMLDAETGAQNDGTAKPDAVFSISADAAARKLGWFIGHLDLPTAALIGEFLLPDQQTKLLAQAALQGELENFSGYLDLDQQTAAVNGLFKRISFAPTTGWPGISNFSGQISGNNRAGRLVFNTENAGINYPDLFRETLAINKLAGPIHWRQTETDWLLSSRLFGLDLLGISSKNRLRFTLPKNSAERPFMDLQMAFSGNDVSQLKHYFPVKAMKPADTDWLDKAFVRGHINQGGILYYGPLGPLHSALFEAVLDVDGVELNYAPDWPSITDLAGRVWFFQNWMLCEAYQGHSHNLNVIQATATNTAVGISKQLQIKGEIDGQLPDALDFLRHTPLNKNIGGLITAIDSEGRTQVDLDLDLALTAEGYTKLDGSAALAQTRLRVKAIDLWVNKITGALKFNEHGVYSDTISAAAFNEPVAINISHDDTKTRVNVDGKAAVDALKKQFAMPFWDYAKGDMRYQLQLDLPLANNPATLSVHSDLVGTALDLPGTLAKQTGQAKPLAVGFLLDNEALLPVTIDYNKQLKAAIKLDVAGQTLHSGHVLLGDGAVNQSADDGLALEINQDQLELSELAALSGAQKSGGKSPALNKLSIHSQQALWKTNPLGPLNLDLHQEGNYWLGDINSPYAQGKMQIPANFDHDGKISLNLQLLDIALIKQLKSQDQAPEPAPAQTSAALSPENLPLFSLNSHNTLWHKVDLGNLTIQTERIPGGIAFKQASLSGPEQKLSLSGSWKTSAGTTKTSVEGSLDIPRTGDLLSQLDITKELKETQGKAEFALNWDAAPYAFAAAGLAGRVDVNLSNGRILSIEPGFGRVLGIVAMAQWAKRLQLDFRDIYQEGLTFNTIEGHFQVRNGSAITDDLVIDAIPAKISMVGAVNFIDKTVDHIVKVTPKSADAVPIAGTIMDNVMNVVSRTLTGKDAEGFLLGSQYRVKGQWEQMKIMPLHENDGLLQKTWTGITDFPWVQQLEK